MLNIVGQGLLILSLLITASTADNGLSRCNCDDEGTFWSIESILECQKVSDLLIAAAYFSIPIELIYFVSCSNLPFKWVLFQFIAFIVLCGMTHLLNGWTYGPHSFQLMLALTVFKILTALVSCATAITLITLIPLLLKVKVREFMLKKKAWDLGREVGMIMRQKETSLHVRMLTQEIRKSLNRHTILYTTLVELSKTLQLQKCAVWMPNEGRTLMNLAHELKGRNYLHSCNISIPISDPDVVRIKGSEGVNSLRPDSLLVTTGSGESGEVGPIAAIRMPMLRVCNFKGGTPEVIQACYAILVLVLPSGQSRSWRYQELEIIKVVADQVAVAISHAAVLEESQLISERLKEQNRALQQARRNALMASQARNSFQKVMSHGMRRPMHTISGLLSMMQGENLNNDQRIIVEAMTRTSNVLSTLINDVTDISPKENVRFPLEMRSFHMHGLIREVACLAKCLCNSRGFNFALEVDKSLPDHVMGDERRVFQVILHMVGKILKDGGREGSAIFRISLDNGSHGRNDQRWAAWKASSFVGDICVKFELGIDNGSSQAGESISIAHSGARRYNSGRVEESLSFSICKRLVQLMQGDIWIIPNPQGFAQSMALILRFQRRASISISIDEPGESSESSNSLFTGMKLLLADHDDVNRAVTQKLLEKLGCSVAAVRSGLECISVIGPTSSAFHIVLLELQMPELDGFEVAARIRKYRSHNWPLIIALTASGDEDLWQRCLQNGMNGVIRKPVMLRGLADELRRVLLQANKFVS